MTDLPDKNQRNINGIPLDGGVHDCHWVFKGKCTNPLVTRNKVGPGFSRDWNSKQRCGLSLLGTIHCSGLTITTISKIENGYHTVTNHGSY